MGVISGMIGGSVEYYSAFFEASWTQKSYQRSYTQIIWRLAKLLCPPDQFLIPLACVLTRSGNDNASQADIRPHVYLYVRQNSSSLPLAKA
jgi:hypothetical protein